MPSVTILGGGLAGLAASAALGSAGFRVRLFESRAFLGGRATSYPVSNAAQEPEIIDNCQHVLLRCCVNLIDFYERLGVGGRIGFEREFYFIEPGGRVSVFRRGLLPCPLHFTESFFAMRCLSPADKLSVARGLLALKSERLKRKDLDEITMLEWLQEKRQSPGAIERFWRQVLVSAVNEELDRMAARHGFQVFWLGFLSKADSYEMGLPRVPLGELYQADVWARMDSVELRLRQPVEAIEMRGEEVDSIRAGGHDYVSDYYVSCLPPDRLGQLAPALAADPLLLETSPITGIHLWFDRAVTELPHATLLDRTIQWMFNKDSGRYLQVVVSASRSLISMSRNEIVDLALSELAEFFPAVRRAHLMRAHVVKEVRATFSAGPGTERVRPEPETAVRNLFLAGDWTRSGWPATMEGAVRSGYRAAEAVTRAAGIPRTFLLPDLA